MSYSAAVSCASQRLVLAGRPRRTSCASSLLPCSNSSAIAVPAQKRLAWTLARSTTCTTVQQSNSLITTGFASSSSAESVSRVVASKSSSTSSSSNHRALEIVLSSILAFAASASLVWAFPSSTPAAQSNSGNVSFHRRTGPDPGGGGGGHEGGEYSAVLFADQQAPVEVDEASSTGTNVTVDSVRRKAYDISVRAIKGGRLTMEDEYFVASGGRFVAVFDGHGGGGVSSSLKRSLYKTFCHFLQVQQWEEYEDRSQKTPPLSTQVAALRSAFDQVERDIVANDTLQYQGSTAVAVVVHESEDGHRTLLSANVGDSRAILSRRGRAIDLTRDHKPSEEREKARILAMGETIEWDKYSKVHRVRNLSLSRAIGDRYAKPAVSGEVEIKHFPVVEDSDEFILLASDGLWDVMTSQDAVSYVHERMVAELERANLSKDDVENMRLVLRRNMSKFVAREAFRRGSGDNICVVMVWLDK